MLLITCQRNAHREEQLYMKKYSWEEPLISNHVLSSSLKVPFKLILFLHGKDIRTVEDAEIEVLTVISNNPHLPTEILIIKLAYQNQVSVEFFNLTNFIRRPIHKNVMRRWETGCRCFEQFLWRVSCLWVSEIKAASKNFFKRISRLRSHSDSNRQLRPLVSYLKIVSLDTSIIVIIFVQVSDTRYIYFKYFLNV